MFRREKFTLLEVPCDPTRFVYHHTGLLISGQGKLSYIKKSLSKHENKILTKDFSDLGIAWVPWSEADYVQYKNVRVSAPSQITNVLTVFYGKSVISMDRNII